MNYTVKNNQNIFDVCLQHYGTLDNLFTMLSDNNLDLNSTLNSGQILIINNNLLGNELIKRTIIKNSYIFVNEQISIFVTGGEFNGEFNDDFNDDFLN